MTVVTIHKAKTTLSELIARAEAGEEIVIARGKEPVVKLQPLGARAPKRQFGVLKGQIAIGPELLEPLPEDEIRAWE